MNADHLIERPHIVVYKL